MEASEITAQQRFLRRKFLTENIDFLLRESNYHRNNDIDEALPGQQLWKMDEEEGFCDGAF